MLRAEGLDGGRNDKRRNKNSLGGVGKRILGVDGV